MFTGPNRLDKGGFTMLEVIIALAIFSIVAGALFQVLDACMQTTTELYGAQRVTRQISTFTEISRKTFATLPGEATLTMPMIEEEYGQEIVFRDAPAVFLFGGSPFNYGTTTLAVRPQEDGLYSLSLSRSDFELPDEEGDGTGRAEEGTELEPDEQGRYWLVLVPDLEWVRWRFYDRQQKDWVESWTKKERPPMVEFTLLLPGDSVPFRAVFSVAQTSATAAQLIVGGGAR